MAVEIKEGLEWAALIIPVATLIFHYGCDHQRIKGLESRFAEFLANCKDCKKDLAAEDDKLHKRMTDHLKESRG